MNDLAFTKLYNAALNLVEQLDFMHDDPSYLSVWGIYHSRGLEYDGPQYVEELSELRQVLEKFEPQYCLPSKAD